MVNKFMYQIYVISAFESDITLAIGQFSKTGLYLLFKLAELTLEKMQLLPNSLQVSCKMFKDTYISVSH